MILIDTQREEFRKLREIRIFGKAENEDQFNGDLLVLGLGGVGSRVVCSLKGMLMDHITPEDNINFLMIDSDIPEMEATIEDSKTGVGMNALEVISIYRPNLEKILANGIEFNPVHPNIANWMRKEFPSISIGTNGAEGNRQIGRLMFSNAYEDMRILLFEKLDELYHKSKTGKLDVIIVSGVAGGTGSGILADVTYNIKAYGKSKKWQNFRVGGCLLMPDVLFGNREIMEDEEKKNLLLANGCATLKEVDYLMRIANRGEGFFFESTTHRLSMRENIFDACMLVSGKKDEQGYIPAHIIYSDVAYFLFKLAGNKQIGSGTGEDGQKLLRDTFFENSGDGSFKIVNESDYRIPIREIENLCEYEFFVEAYSQLKEFSDMEAKVKMDWQDRFSDIIDFLNGAPGDEINLNINELIRPAQFGKPAYKEIKKGQDDLRRILPRQLSRLEQELPAIVKTIKNKIFATLDEMIATYMRRYGPFITIDMIGAAGIGNCVYDSGMIAQLKKLEEIHRQYRPTGQYKRILESILDIVAKRFFTFPAAKKETENGYYDACIKNALEKERTLIMDGLDLQDVFGDGIRLLRQKAERIAEVFMPFGDDLKYAMEELAGDGKKVVGYLLKDAKQHEFLPSDYVTKDRVNELRQGLINLMVNHEADIDNGRVVPVKQEMEKVFRNILMGIGVYAPEKLVSVAFSDKKPTLQDINMMFVSPTNEKREEIMNRAAKAFVEGAQEKTEKKLLCILKDGYQDKVTNRKFISLPEAMPYFSQAVKELFLAEPYNESEESITLNKGELEISVDDIFTDVPLSMLMCAEEMQAAYDEIRFKQYIGLHTDEVNRDMYSYPNIV